MGVIRGVTIRMVSVLLAVAAAGWLGVSASHAAKITLDAGPAVEVFDLPIHAEIHGLSAGEQVTVQATSYDGSEQLWKSWAQFTAGSSGTVDLATAVPEKGTYRIANASGLLWSLQSSTRFFNAGNGYTVSIQVLVGGEVAAQQTLSRSVPAVSQSVSVSQAGFVGRLFLRPDAAPDTPAVIVIGGSEGGVPSVEAAAFQAAGYPAMAVGYFHAPGLPACLCSVPLEYFAHAVAWLRSQPGFATRPLVLWGASRGGEGALVLASYEPDLFDAVVAVSPSDQVNGSFGEGAGSDIPAWTLNGQPLTPGPIPVDRMRVPVVLVAGGSDIVWNSTYSAASVMRQLDARPGAPAHTYLFYSGAGHSVAGLPPNVPFHAEELGGTVETDELAAADAWPRILAFIHSAKPHAASGG